MKTSLRLFRLNPRDASAVRTSEDSRLDDKEFAAFTADASAATVAASVTLADAENKKKK